VGRVHLGGAAQMALPLGGLLGEDVAHVGLRALDAAGGADLEALRRRLLRLHFRHDCPSFYSLTPGVPPRGRLVAAAITCNPPPVRRRALLLPSSPAWAWAWPWAARPFSWVPAP